MKSTLFEEYREGTTLASIGKRKDGMEERDTEGVRTIIKHSSPIIIILIFSLLFFLLSLRGYSNNKNNLDVGKKDEEDNNLVYNLTFDTTTIKITTTTSTTTKPKTTTTTTLIPTTTTTIVEKNEKCGGDWEPPCETQSGLKKCNEGYVIGSEGFCHILECAPSVPSGREGCGGWALNYCRRK